MVKLDGLGRRIVQIFKNDRRVTAISRDAIGGTLERQESSISRATKSVGADCFVFNGNEIDRQTVLGKIISKSGLNSNTSGSDQGSYYRALCENLEKLKRVVIVIYEADLISRREYSVLSRVYGFAKRNNLVFHIILIGDINAITKNIYLTGIKIDQFIPRSSESLSYERRGLDLFSISYMSEHTQ